MSLLYIRKFYYKRGEFKMNIDYSIDFIKETEQLAYYVNDHRDAQKPPNWKSVKTYENRKTGFKAEQE